MSKRPTGKVILQAPFTSLPNELRDFLPILALYPREVFPEPHLDNISAVRALHPPLLIIHGKLDHTVPVEHSYKLYEAASQPKSLLILKSGSHNLMKLDRVGRSQLEEALRQFLRE